MVSSADAFLPILLSPFLLNQVESLHYFILKICPTCSETKNIIWDGLPAHRGQVVKDFLRAGAARRIHFEQLPGYVPDLNPTEGIWQYLKYVEMKNLCCHTLDELCHELRKAIARLRHKTDVICACIDHAHLGQHV